MLCPTSQSHYPSSTSDDDAAVSVSRPPNTFHLQTSGCSPECCDPCRAVCVCHTWSGSCCLHTPMSISRQLTATASGLTCVSAQLDLASVLLLVLLLVPRVSCIRLSGLSAKDCVCNGREGVTQHVRMCLQGCVRDGIINAAHLPVGWSSRYGQHSLKHTQHHTKDTWAQAPSLKCGWRTARFPWSGTVTRLDTC